MPKNCDESEEERARRLTQKWKRRQKTKCSHCPVKSVVRLMSTREQWLVKQRMAVSRSDHILTFGEVFKTSLTSWNSFNVHFAILLTLCCTTILKAHATPTNSNAHVSPVGSKVIDMCVRHTLRICIPSHVIWTINIQQRRTLQQSRTSHRSA